MSLLPRRSSHTSFGSFLVALSLHIVVAILLVYFGTTAYIDAKKETPVDWTAKSLSGGGGSQGTATHRSVRPPITVNPPKRIVVSRVDAAITLPTAINPTTQSFNTSLPTTRQMSSAALSRFGAKSIGNGQGNGQGNGKGDGTGDGTGKGVPISKFTQSPLKRPEVDRSIPLSAIPATPKTAVYVDTYLCVKLIGYHLGQKEPEDFCETHIVYRKLTKDIPLNNSVGSLAHQAIKRHFKGSTISIGRPAHAISEAKPLHQSFPNIPSKGTVVIITRAEPFKTLVGHANTTYILQGSQLKGLTQLSDACIAKETKLIILSTHFFINKTVAHYAERTGGYAGHWALPEPPSRIR